MGGVEPPNQCVLLRIATAVMPEKNVLKNVESIQFQRGLKNAVNEAYRVKRRTPTHPITKGGTFGRNKYNQLKSVLEQRTNNVTIISHKRDIPERIKKAVGLT